MEKRIPNFMKLLQRSKEMAYVRVLYRNIDCFSNSNSVQQLFGLFHIFSLIITNTWGNFIKGENMDPNMAEISFCISLTLMNLHILIQLN